MSKIKVSKDGKALIVTIPKYQKEWGKGDSIIINSGKKADE